MTTGDPWARLTPALCPAPDGPCHSLNVGEGRRGPRDGFRAGARPRGLGGTRGGRFFILHHFAGLCGASCGRVTAAPLVKASLRWVRVDGMPAWRPPRPPTLFKHCGCRWNASHAALSLSSSAVWPAEIGMVADTLGPPILTTVLPPNQWIPKLGRSPILPGSNPSLGILTCCANGQASLASVFSCVKWDSGVLG